MADDSDNCVDREGSVRIWVLLGLFLFLAFMSKTIMRLLFRGVSGALKSLRLLYLYEPFRKLFINPISVLLSILFVYLACNIAPWPCSLDGLRRFIDFLITCAALLTLWIVILRAFEYLRITIQYIKLDPILINPLREGIRVASMAVLFCVGLLFFSIIVMKIDSNTAFTPSLFFGALNFFSLTWSLFFVPAFKDVIGGLGFIADRPFEISDWIEIDGSRGTVERVGLFTTAIRSLAGSVIVIANSRFINSVYIVYKASRRRVCSFQFPLTPQQETSDENNRRSLITSVEMSLSSLSITDTAVRYCGEDDRHFLEIRFITMENVAVEEQVRLLNLAVFQVMATMREPEGMKQKQA